MPVHVEEVETQVRDDPRGAKRGEPGAGDDQRSAASDPQLALRIDHVVALRRSRDLRLHAD